MNLCKSARIGGAELKQEVGNVQKYSKSIPPSSSTQTANLIFDDMQHDNSSLTTSTTIKSNDYTKSTSTILLKKVLHHSLLFLCILNFQYL